MHVGQIKLKISHVYLYNSSVSSLGTQRETVGLILGSIAYKETLNNLEIFIEDSYKCSTIQRSAHQIQFDPWKCYLDFKERSKNENLDLIRFWHSHLIESPKKNVIDGYYIAKHSPVVLLFSAFHKYYFITCFIYLKSIGDIPIVNLSLVFSERFHSFLIGFNLK